MQKIDIKLKPSKLFIIFIALAVLCCMAIIYTLPMIKWGKGLLLAVITRYGWVLLRDYGFLQGGNSITSLSFTGDTWQLHDRLRVSEAKLLGESTLTTLVCILCFNTQAGRRYCIVFKDALPKEEYRKLSVLARTASAMKAQENRASRHQTVLRNNNHDS